MHAESEKPLCSPLQLVVHIFQQIEIFVLMIAHLRERKSNGESNTTLGFPNCSGKRTLMICCGAHEPSHCLRIQTETCQGNFTVPSVDDGGDTCLTHLHMLHAMGCLGNTWDLDVKATAILHLRDGNTSSYMYVA